MMRSFIIAITSLYTVNAFTLHTNINSPKTITKSQYNDLYQPHNLPKDNNYGYYNKNDFGEKLQEPTKTTKINFDKIDRYPQEHPIVIQGDSLKTWTYKSYNTERVQVTLGSTGRPVSANVNLWNGPNNTPFNMNVYLEDGKESPLDVVIETPSGANTVAVKNSGEIEFPITATLSDINVDRPSYDCLSSFEGIQGGALKTYNFDSSVESVQVMIKTDGRPINARIELLQGPNNNKQVMDLYIEDGYARPFLGVIKTPGPGSVVRIVNTATMEFPMRASVVSHSNNYAYSTPVMN